MAMIRRLYDLSCLTELQYRQLTKNKGHNRVDIYNDLFLTLDVDKISNLHSITHSLAYLGSNRIVS